MLGVSPRGEGDERDDAAVARKRLQGASVLEEAGGHDGGETAALREAVEAGVEVRFEVLERRIRHDGVVRP